MVIILNGPLGLSDVSGPLRCFLLTLPMEENLRRIERRQSARAVDEEPFDVSATPADLVATLKRRMGLTMPIERRGRM